MSVAQRLKTLVPYSTNSGSLYHKGSTNFIYNADNSISVTPSFNQDKRWQRERKLNDRLSVIDSEDNRLLAKFLSLDDSMDDSIKQQHIAILTDRMCTLAVERSKILEQKSTNYDRKNKRTDGFSLSPKAKRKVRGLTHLLFADARHRKTWLEFVTLTATLPKKTKREQSYKDSDLELSKIFKSYIDNLRKSYGLTNYLYVVERQKRGYIHYHCIFLWENNSPSIFNLNLYWLSLLNKHGFQIFSRKNYKDLSNDRLKLAIERQDFKTYFKISPMYVDKDSKVHTVSGGTIKLSKILLNPVDTRKIYNKNGLSKYLTKYLTKSDDKIYTRCWGASKVLLSCPTSISIDSPDSLHYDTNSIVTDSTNEEIEKTDLLSKNSVHEVLELGDEIVFKVVEFKKAIHGRIYTFSRWLLNENYVKSPTLLRCENWLNMMFRKIVYKC